jgi:hypothetical protein
MIELYPHLSWSPDIDFDKVIESLENIHESIVKPLQAYKDFMYDGKCAIMLSKWHPISEDTYLGIVMMMNVNKPNEYKLRVSEGYTCDDGMHEGDGFIDIKTEKEHVENAIRDIMNGTIPLWNRDDCIDLSKYTYILHDSV